MSHVDRGARCVAAKKHPTTGCARRAQEDRRTRTQPTASVADAIVVPVPPIRAARRHCATVVIATAAVRIGVVIIAVAEPTAATEASDMAAITATDGPSATDVPAIHGRTRCR